MHKRTGKQNLINIKSVPFKNKNRVGLFFRHCLSNETSHAINNNSCKPPRPAWLWDDLLETKKLLSLWPMVFKFSTVPRVTKHRVTQRVTLSLISKSFDFLGTWAWDDCCKRRRATHPKNKFDTPHVWLKKVQSLTIRWRKRIEHTWFDGYQPALDLWPPGHLELGFFACQIERSEMECTVLAFSYVRSKSRNG